MAAEFRIEYTIEDRDDFARAIALVDSLVDPPLSGRYGRYADAVMDRLHALGYRKQEPVSEPTEAEVEAAFKSWNGWHVGTVRDRLRAALVAARAVTNGDGT